MDRLSALTFFVREAMFKSPVVLADFAAVMLL
jgi:hypothetical protein